MLSNDSVIRKTTCSTCLQCAWMHTRSSRRRTTWRPSSCRPRMATRSTRPSGRSPLTSQVPPHLLIHFPLLLVCCWLAITCHYCYCCRRAVDQGRHRQQEQHRARPDRGSREVRLSLPPALSAVTHHPLTLLLVLVAQKRQESKQGAAAGLQQEVVLRGIVAPSYS